MRKLLFALFTLIISFLVIAKNPRHMMVVNQAGVGGFASYEHFNPRSSSLFDSYEIFTGNFEFNYSYTINERWQIGGLFKNYNQTREIDLKQGSEGEIDTDLRIIGVQLLYNLDENLADSWYLAGILSYLNQEEEFDKDIQDFLEDDREAVSFEGLLGKRFALFPKNSVQVSYSPAASIFVTNSTKDYADDKINYSYGLNLHFLKFDVLF